MMLSRRHVLVLALASLGSAALPAAACTTPRDLASIQANVVAGVNAARRAAGLSPISAAPELMEAAQRHACDNAKRSKMSHTGGDGSSVGTRAKRAGYRWRTISENVAAGRMSAEGVVDVWMNSPPHRRNILKGGNRHVGVGVAIGADGAPQWVLVTGAPR